MAEDDVRSHVLFLLAERRWRQADLVRAASVDKNTISTFLTGKSKPSTVTLAKIEAALELTPGTLAAIGEEEDRRAAWAAEVQRMDDPFLREATDEQLLAELAWRMVQLRRDAMLEPIVQHAHYRESRFDGDPDDDAAYVAWINREAMVQQAAQRGITREEFDRSNPIAAANAAGGDVDSGSPASVTHLPRPDDGGLVDRAADDRVNQGRALRDHLDSLSDET